MSDSSKNPNFRNPYSKLKKAERVKTSIIVGEADLSRMLAAHPGYGTFQATTTILFRKFLDAYEQQHPKSEYNSDGWEAAVLNCTIDLGNGGTVEQPTGRTRRSRPVQAID